jgi:alcohol dehydrogenase (NADP+)
MGLGTLFLKDTKAIEHAITKVGYRHIDTASITGNEKEVGQAMNNAISTGGLHRDELFVTTKMWHNQYADPEAALKKSLSLMKLDCVDMYVIHWPNNNFSNPTVPMHMLWQDMERLVDLGLTNSIGLSNFNTQLTADIFTYARHKPVYNQV